jgi:putative methionine-R-sulfoxide reductase with GAF domain
VVDSKRAAKPKKTAGGGYVERVREKTQAYVRDLLAENEKLRDLARTLEAELDRQKKDKLHLEEKLTIIEREAKRYFEQYVDVELQNANVANLYVASFRLHGTLKRDEVLAAMTEIIVNLVGSEEFTIYEASDDGSKLVTASAFGMRGEALREVALGRGIIGQCAQTGETFVRGDDANEPEGAERNLTACVPLKVDGKVTGAVAIFRLLGHKRGLEDVDRELFALLGTQAAMALFCSKLVSKLG